MLIKAVKMPRVQNTLRRARITAAISLCGSNGVTLIPLKPAVNGSNPQRLPCQAVESPESRRARTGINYGIGLGMWQVL